MRTTNCGLANIHSICHFTQYEKQFIRTILWLMNTKYIKLVKLKSSNFFCSLEIFTFIKKNVIFVKNQVLIFQCLIKFQHFYRGKIILVYILYKGKKGKKYWEHKKLYSQDTNLWQEPEHTLENWKN